MKKEVDLKIEWESNPSFNNKIEKSEPKDFMKEVIPQKLNQTILQKWKELYILPIVYHNEGTAIHDGRGNKILDIRGWGKIQKYPDPEKIQDNFGNLVAHLITEWYKGNIKIN